MLLNGALLLKLISIASLSSPPFHPPGTAYALLYDIMLRFGIVQTRQKADVGSRIGSFVFYVRRSLTCVLVMIW